MLLLRRHSDGQLDTWHDFVYTFGKLGLLDIRGLGHLAGHFGTDMKEQKTHYNHKGENLCSGRSWFGQKSPYLQEVDCYGCLQAYKALGLLEAKKQLSRLGYDVEGNDETAKTAKTDSSGHKQRKPRIRRSLRDDRF